MANGDTSDRWNTMTYRQAQPRNNTCLIVGGIGCLSIILLVIIVVSLLYSSAKTVVSTLVEEFTDTQPVPLPEVVLDQEQIDSAVSRWNAFRDALVHQTPTETLTLTSDDVNALINHHPDWSMLKGQAYVTLEGNKILAQVSVSLEPFTTIPLFGKYVKGRYFNGKAAFDLFVRNGVLFLTLQNAEVKGKPIPPEAIAEVRQKNLAEDVRQNPDIAAILDRIERLEISDGKAVIVPKKLSENMLPAPSMESSVPSEASQTPAEAPAN